MPLIAEDLGSLTRKVESLRDAFGLPGMHILQYSLRRRRLQPRSAA
ncbi:MAG: 4-alpha-glucanotransferase [Acidobacteria bacterium]|nr:4-alpha-glucanotransferase [Acidobacteriota bacterium]